MVAPRRTVVVQAIVRMEIEDAIRKSLIGVVTALDVVRGNEVVQRCFTAVDGGVAHPLALW